MTRKWFDLALEQSAERNHEGLSLLDARFRGHDNGRRIFAGMTIVDGRAKPGHDGRGRRDGLPV